MKGKAISRSALVPCQPPRARGCVRAGRSAGRAGGAFAGGFSRVTPPASPEVVTAALHRLGCRPPNTADCGERPLSAIPAANVPHFPLIHLSKASCSEALAQRIHRSPPAAAGSRCSSGTHRHRARGRAPTRHLRFARENHSSACKSPSCKGGPSVRPGRHGRGNPSSTDALFIRRFSIPRVGGGAGGGRLARPPPPRPRAGETPELCLSPILTPAFCVGIFTWRTAASLLRTKPRELYSDTRE